MARKTPPTQTELDPKSPTTDDDSLPNTILDPADIVRDPLHGDIRLSRLERFVIDQPAFQRLRGLNQLALTYIAYPGALHTRYLHSLGTLHVCTRMIEICNSNADIYRRHTNAHAFPLRIGRYAATLARLCALMHDMAHVPFGHTLEKEGGIFSVDEWKDAWRVEQIFDEASVFLQKVRAFLTNELGVEARTANQLLRDVRDVVTCPRENVSQLPYPFVHDLVGNTICADLLDYVQRDMFFCGLSERFGDRFLRYLAVMPLGATDRRPIRVSQTSDDKYRYAQRAQTTIEPRIVLLQYRFNERQEAVTKHDIVAEAIDLVRRRLAVAEKLYFHRTKMAASAMLVSAAMGANLRAMDIWELYDIEVLRLLANDARPGVSRIGRALLDRRIYKPIYRVSYHAKDESATSGRLWGANGVYQRYKRADARRSLIAQIEHLIALDCFDGKDSGAAGTVAVSCPDEGMNLKAFDMLTLPSPDGVVRRLEDTDHKPSQAEIAAIKDTHLHLWCFRVYVDPLVLPPGPNPTTARIARIIQQTIGPLNEIESTLGDALVEATLHGELRVALKQEGIAMENVAPKEIGELEASCRGISDVRTVVAEFAERMRGNSKVN